MNENIEKSEEVNNTLYTEYCFPSQVFFIEKPEFLDIVKTVSEENLTIKKSETVMDEIYPLYMTNNFYDDKRLSLFCEYIGNTAWNILETQGYNMKNKTTSFIEMWTQEHHKMSSMDSHVHSYGSQIVGFYFLETPENCSRVVFHDPRSGKVQIDLDEQDSSLITPASKMINFEPKAGMMIFANSWLPHSFTRHGSDKPIKFVHFNLTVINSQSNTTESCKQDNVEVI